MSEAPLRKLRISFVSLGVVLLLALAALLLSAVSRLNEQRRLRQEMVAERVFDEAEREISSLLQHEAERPSAAYDTVDSDPARWSTFVVGYYRRDPQLQLLSESRLGESRAKRVRDAVIAAEAQLDSPSTAPKRVRPALDTEQAHDTAPSSPDVLRQLNRSVKVRERRLRDLDTVFAVVAASRTTLVFERESPDTERREGFVVNVPDLVATIQRWVLSAQGLDKVASLHLAAQSMKRPRDEGLTHRLAAPLDSQTVFLKLSKLGDEDASGALYQMAALLAATVVLGLWAIYRMVAVQVRFAERRNNFVAAVTHELKTPLTSIRMYGEMLRDGMVTDERTRQDYYGIITAEGERLTRLVNNVMEHAKLRQGQRRAHLVKCDVHEVVASVVELMRPHFDSEGFGVEVTAEPNLPCAQLDVDALKQVLFNVFDNALKYGRGEHERKLHVACSRLGDWVFVSVRDFGPGVASEQLRSIFEPFFRGEDELTRRQKGTGIGLALVRDLVELMNGRVTASNQTPGFEIRIALRL